MKKWFLFFAILISAMSVDAVDYLNVLEYYSKYDKTNVKGTIIKSEKKVTSSYHTLYIYYYQNNWEKVLSISTCPYCHEGKCTGIHVWGYCVQCGNTGKCRYCGGTGKSITVHATNYKTGWYIDSEGRASPY